MQRHIARHQFLVQFIDQIEFHCGSEYVFGFPSVQFYL